MTMACWEDSGHGRGRPLAILIRIYTSLTMHCWSAGGSTTRAIERVCRFTPFSTAGSPVGVSD